MSKKSSEEWARSIVSFSKRDIRTLFGSYNIQLYLSRESNKKSHLLAVTYLIEELKRNGYEVDDESFWNGDSITPIEGLTFIKDPRTHTFILTNDQYSLSDDLRNSKEINQLLRSNQKFGFDLYNSLCNVEWEKNGIHWSCTWRYASELIGDLVDNNKGGYYCSGNEGTVTPIVEQKLNIMGWKRVKNNLTND